MEGDRPVRLERVERTVDSFGDRVGTTVIDTVRCHATRKDIGGREDASNDIRTSERRSSFMIRYQDIFEDISQSNEWHLVDELTNTIWDIESSNETKRGIFYEFICTRRK